MARPSRQQRRERRAQQPALAGAGTPPTLPTPRAARTGGADEPSGRRFNFFRESYGELKKVEWPDQKAVISGTSVVLIACIIVGTFLWLNDELWKYVVQHVLLK